MADILERIRAHAASRPLKVISVPEWGLEKVHLKPLTLAEKARLNRETSESRKVARFLMLAMRDEAGKPIFADSVETMACLEAEADSHVVERLCGEITREVVTLDEAKNG